MTSIELIIPERAADIGNFMVGRILPFRQRRTVGPFTFIDHMGSAKMGPAENLDVAPHPHIGLSTLTYLFAGAIEHKDSLGSNIEIKPGAVNWMSAGRGVVHSERTPAYLRSSTKTLHGLQIWVAMPKHLEQSEPTFVHIAEKEIPQWSKQGAEFKLIAGSAFGNTSPVPVHSELYFIEIKNKDRQQINLGTELYGERALYILKGSIRLDDQSFGPKQMLVIKESEVCSFEMEPETTIYGFGGIPFEEERFIHWNFVNSDKQAIEKAKKDWADQNRDAFPKVPGDEKEYVPLPLLG